MAKYRKKPVLVEAFQMTKETRWDNKDWPNWMHKAWNETPDGKEGSIWSTPEEPDQLFCGTLEGKHVITYGDFIIQGVKDELYPCKPDIFEASYEKV